MDMSILKDKEQRVLTLIVEAYLEGGRPVSSGEVFRKKRFPGSPATLRNVMVRLEAKGYLSQPHTSAGRVPTDEGLRFYVNSLLAEALFPRDETALVPEDLGSKRATSTPSLSRSPGSLPCTPTTWGSSSPPAYPRSRSATSGS